MLFMIMTTDAEHTTAARQKVRPQHLLHLENLAKQDRLILAGPNPLPENHQQFSGSLIVAEFGSLDDAETWAKKDPYVDAGVYAEILIRPFKQVFPK